MAGPNTNPLTYNAYVTQVATMAVVNTTTSAGVVVGVDAAFNAIIPQMLNYAELRIQRDLDLLPSQTTVSYTLTAGNNLLTIGVDDFVVIQSIRVGGVAGVPSQNPLTMLTPATKEFIRNIYPDNTFQSLPIYFAPYGADATLGSGSLYYLLGPTPDVAYPAIVYGTQRMPSLYKYANTAQAGTNTTFISTYLPDLLVQASMIYISEYQRNFTPVSNDPQMLGAYEGQYQALLQSAMAEEFKKKWQASAWSSSATPPVATPTR